MSFQPPTKASPEKTTILRDIHAHVHPDRVDTLLDAGIDFVPDRREGYRYWDRDGRELMDLHLNGGTFNLGHRHPELVNCLSRAMDHWDIGNHHFPSGPRAELARALIDATPGAMQYVVFTPSGSESNDVAIKAARRVTGRQKVVALAGGYHGRSGLSGAAGDDRDARYFLSDDPARFVKVPFNDLAAMERALKGRDVALVLMETIPATLGFPIPDDDYLPGVKALCEKYGSLYAADEVQTGLGRTGHRWAVEAWEVEPDMLIAGKGLSGGLYPISAVVMTARCGDWLTDHGWAYVSTFGGAELGCVVAKEVLRISLAEATLTNARRQAERLRQGLEQLMPRFPFFEEIRQKGLVFGLKFSDSMAGLGMMRALYENGVWALVAGFDDSVLQFKPGLLVDDAYCEELLGRFEDACIWLANNQGALIMGPQPADDDPQILPLRQLAETALGEWNLHGASLRLLKHRENTVFQVEDGTGQRHVLRVHRHGYHDDAELASEIAWSRALNEHGIDTPAVIRTRDGRDFAVISHPAVEQPRQCSLLEWVDGQPFDHLGRVESGMREELIRRYRALGALAARLHNQAQAWQPPPDFVRQAWDADGLLGEQPLWGRFWEHPVLTPAQAHDLCKLRIVLRGLLDQLGTGPEIYGLIHADFLPENILVADERPRLIDFDDAGYGWHLFEMATSLFPQVSAPYFEELAEAYLAGYRKHRPMSDEHFALLPAFILLRGLSYLGWLHTRAGSLRHGDRIAREVAKGLCEAMPQVLAEISPLQRAGVELLARVAPLRDRLRSLR